MSAKTAMPYALPSLSEDRKAATRAMAWVKAREREREKRGWG
jgi:hypothetical protein